MTTGRINQVTISGESPPHTTGLRTARPPPERVGSPRSPQTDTASKAVLQSLAHLAPTEGQRRAPGAGRRPLRHCRPRGVDPTTKHRRLALHAKRCNPDSNKLGAGGGLERNRPRPDATARPQPPSKPGSASAGPVTPHAAPRQDARQGNVSLEVQALALGTHRRLQ